MLTCDWDDLRFVLAVARQGSVAAAARTLGVTHPTILRRLQRAEKDYGIRIFDRLTDGYVPTDGGHTLVATAGAIEASINDSCRHIAEKRSRMEGILHFTTTEALMDWFIPPMLAGFREQYPSITLKLTVTNNLLNIEKRDADVALRPSLSPPDELVGMRLSRVSFGIYAAPSYLEKRGKSDLNAMDWLLPDGILEHSPASRWIRKVIPAERIVFNADSFVALRNMAEAGLGVTILPLCVVRPSSGLKQIEAEPIASAVDLWVLTHADLRHAAYIYTFMNYIAVKIRAQRELIEVATPVI